MPENFVPQVGAYYVTQIPGLLGFLVRIAQALFGDFSIYTHAGMYVGGGVCVEAAGRGVRTVPLAVVMQRRPLAWSVDPILLKTGRTAAAAAMADVGDAYGWLTYGELLADRLGLKVPRLRALVSRSTHTICSQAVVRWCEKAGWQLVSPSRKPGDTTPGALAQAGTVWHVDTGPFVS